VKERELREAQSRARQQAALTESELSITVLSNQGKAEYQRALQKAAEIRALAEAEAERTARLGIAQAIAIEAQVHAYGGPQYQVTQHVMSRFAKAVERARVDVVPRVQIGAAGGAGSASLMEGLLAMLLAKRAGIAATNGKATRPEAEVLRQAIRDKIKTTWHVDRVRDFRSTNPAHLRGYGITLNVIRVDERD
jgi:hypothetical protein